MIDSGCHRIVRALTLLVLATGLTAAQSPTPAAQSSSATMGVPLSVDHLQPGSYVVELRASDSAGQSSVARKAEFTVE
jgi:hypothetical protein